MSFLKNLISGFISNYGDDVARGRSRLKEHEYVAVSDEMLRRMGFKP